MYEYIHFAANEIVESQERKNHVNCEKEISKTIRIEMSEQCWTRLKTSETNESIEMNEIKKKEPLNGCEPEREREEDWMKDKKKRKKLTQRKSKTLSASMCIKYEYSVM